MPETRIDAAERRTRIAGLDGLRALAAGSVFLANLRHFVPLESTKGPFELARFAASGVGVCFFFILSGYLLTRAYWRDPAGWTPWRQPFSYVSRRVVRLLPAYLLCLAALVALKRHWSTPHEMADTVLHGLLVHNFAEFSFYGINDPFWTIAVQAQFYALLPLAMLVAQAPSRRPRAIFVAVLVLSAASFWLHSAVVDWASRLEPWPIDRAWVQPNGFVLTKSTLAHLPIFLLGCSLGYIAHQLSRSASGVARAARCAAFWLAAIAVALMTATRLEDALALPHARYLYPFLPAALAVVTLFVADSGVLRLLEWRPLRLIGVISYGFYIFHFPCLKAASALLSAIPGSRAENAWALGLTGLALTAAVASVVYILVERPIELALGAANRAAAPTAPAHPRASQ